MYSRYSHEIGMANATTTRSPPRGRRLFMPHAVEEDYYQRQCDLFFPKQGNSTHGSAAGKTTESFNALTEGWNLKNTTRLLWSNGYVTKLGPIATEALTLNRQRIRSLEVRVRFQRAPPRWTVGEHSRNAGVSATKRHPLQRSDRT